MGVAFGAHGCLHHAAREAVARCPECREYFCRECITEHDSRVICSACLKKLAPAKESARRSWTAVLRPVLVLCGVLLGWFFFYLVGSLATSLPSSFHTHGVETFSREEVD